MEDIYNDLENYDDVDLVNQLRSENAELKHKLGECNSSMQQLQKDFDKVSAEFKTLEKNYSSLLKIARSEIKRKTDMIANLNVEKDMLVIKAMQSGPRNVEKLLRNVHTEALKPKKKKRNKTADAKDRDAFIIRKDERPPSSEGSSTATDHNNQMLRTERVKDGMTSGNRYTTSQKEGHNVERRGDGSRSPIPDRRVSTLARQRFSKLSSDEEFEDMYSAFEPKPSFRGSDRSRKRGRDHSQDGRSNYNAPGPHDRPSDYPEPFREGFNKSRSNRLSDADRNVNRDKSRESERNRDKHDLHYRKYSPERRRRSARDLSDDRYAQQQHERHRRVESPPRQRYQHRSRERRAYRSREREDDKHVHKYNTYPDTHRHKIHDEYDEPQNKRPRMDSAHQEERHNERQYSKEFDSRDTVDRTCQSPDFSHTENESCNESVREIRSTASTIIEDPRLNSSKYVKKTEGNKDVLCTANDNGIELQLVDRNLWDANGPKILTSKPIEISEEHVEKMEAEKALSIVSMESMEFGSEATDTYLDEFADYSKIDEGARSSYKNVSIKNDTQKMYRGNDEEKSPIDNISNDVACNSVVVQKELKPIKLKSRKSEKASKRSRVDEPPELPPLDENKLDTETHRDSTEKPSILHKLIESVRDIPDSPERVKIVKSSKDPEGKKLKRIPKLKISYKSDKELSISTEETENKSLQEWNTSNKPDNDTSENTGRKEMKRLRKKRKSDMSDKELSKSSERTDLNNLSVLKPSNSSEKETPKSTKGLELQSSCESRASDKTESDTPKSSAGKEASSRAEKETSKSIEEEHPKKLSVLKKIDKSEKETEKSSEEHKSFSPFIIDSSNKETENNVAIFREFEHRVYSTRFTVEGDLELSDESNDETQAPLKIDEKVEVSKKRKTKGSKDKQVDVENPTRKTKKKKDKEKELKPTKHKSDLDTKSKFTELFGDSSSLITPEELGLATTEAHAVPADCCPPLYEDALDGTAEPLKLQTQPPNELYDIPESKTTVVSTTDEAKQKSKTKDSKSRTNIKHKDTETNDTRNIPDNLSFSEAMEQNDSSKGSRLAAELKLALSDEKLKEKQKANMASDVNKDVILKHNEKPKDHVKTSKRRKDEKRLSTSEPSEESQIKKCYDPKPAHTQETNVNKCLVMGDNKENASYNDNSERNISGEMAQMFEDTLVSSKITSDDTSKVGEEKLLSIEKANDTATQDGLNLAPVIDEPGLVKTVVISTGIQPPESNIVPYPPLDALATSTPAKGPTINTSSEIDSSVHHTTVNVTIASEDPVSQRETDAPDMRITYYKRRRKVLKR